MIVPLVHLNGHTLFANGIHSESRVLDLGANRGAFALALRGQFACHCVCVEPNPVLGRHLTTLPGITVLSLAVAAHPGWVPFHLADNSEASSMLGRDLGDGRTINTVEVEAATLPECLRRAGWASCDLVKMDIEGAEITVLESCSDDFIRSIPQFTVEFHDFCGITPPADIKRVVGRLRALGFLELSTWREFHGDVVFVQRHRIGLSLPGFWFAKYWVRNWWGLRRVITRTLGASPRDSRA